MKHAVTGGFGYSGSYIVRRLLDAGEEVITLTNTPRKPGSPDIPAYPLKFDDSLVGALAGVDVLYNTYWVRFNHRNFTHRQAVENSRALFTAAKRAGVRRIVHVSITNPSAQSHLEYFSGKAQVERALIESGVAYAILRPAVLFGGDDILINNIA
ncbi:MAG: NAD(P)H-binding protein, partial [Anaerolineae bacterium]|nr:NAD(P)H-binding protein [Anaerolineae bacterium]